jgi:hypothetical protein
MVQHFTMGHMADPCPMPACRGGGPHVIGGPIGVPNPHRTVAMNPHPTVAMQHPMNGNWHHDCGNDPDCHHHHHHFDNFAFFAFNNGPYYYDQPEPDCWVWSHRLHHWVWACGPYYPSY